MDNINFTNEEIWNFLKNKMRKNGLTSNIYSCTKVDDNGFPCFFLEEAYKNKDVHNAIAIAYRSGYERAMKGLPFKISEKKEKEHVEYQSLAFKGKDGKWHLAPQPNLLENSFFTKKKSGHWEHINPNNLPKEGTRVRYSREIDKDYNVPFTEWSGMKIDDETVVMYSGLLFGVRDIYNKFPNSKFVCCSDYPSRFDMWVEDDE